VQRAALQLSLFSDTEEADVRSGFSVRESGRARQLSIKVYPRGRVEVVVPRRTRSSDVQAFVSEHYDWIQKAREGFAREHTPEPFRLPDRIDLVALGQRYVVHYEMRANAKTVRCHCRDGQIILSGATSNDMLCVAALKRWLSSTARKQFEPRLRALSVLTDNPFKKMQVRAQKTCWGSHSSTGSISINYCLLFLEPALLRYLMIHELSHARHMNHSRRFWAAVGKHEPDYRRLDKQLSDAWKQIPSWLGIY
jgi:predicted metal-dependent hydrolase